jgi:hypothetical protein
MYAKRRIFVCQVDTSGANFREGEVRSNQGERTSSTEFSLVELLGRL